MNRIPISYRWEPLWIDRIPLWHDGRYDRRWWRDSQDTIWVDFPEE